MLHVAPWFWFAVVTLVSWGIVGLLQKLSTNYISAESSLIWLVVGFLLLEPLFYPGKAVLHYGGWNLTWALLSGILNALGAWALFAAMKSGGKASIISPLTALYPLVVVMVAPIILRESITMLQAGGVVCALVAVVLLSTEPQQETAGNTSNLTRDTKGKII
ncbi:MAG: DMT family transporter [Terriglobia bacterium]